MNDPDITRYLESRFNTYTVAQLRDYVAERRRDPDSLFLAIVLNEGDRHIGNIKIGPMQWFHRTGDIGIIIGEKDCWGRGYAAEAIELLTRYALETLGLAKVTASCYHMNVGSQRAFLKAGFAEEGVRRSQYESDGARADQLLFGAWKPYDHRRMHHD
jgi:RimJ/RimL family protein N-acetyltransferase